MRCVIWNENKLAKHTFWSKKQNPIFSLKIWDLCRLEFRPAKVQWKFCVTERIIIKIVHYRSRFSFVWLPKVYFQFAIVIIDQGAAAPAPVLDHTIIVIIIHSDGPLAIDRACHKKMDIPKTWHTNCTFCA